MVAPNVPRDGTYRRVALALRKNLSQPLLVGFTVVLTRRFWTTRLTSLRFCDLVWVMWSPMNRQGCWGLSRQGTLGSRWQSTLLSRRSRGKGRCR